jgi:hypothetical protein
MIHIYLKKFGLPTILKIGRRQPKNASSMMAVFWAMLNYRVIIAHCWDANNASRMMNTMFLAWISWRHSKRTRKWFWVGWLSIGCSDLALEECVQTVSMGTAADTKYKWESSILFCKITYRTECTGVPSCSAGYNPKTRIEGNNCQQLVQ